MPWWEVIAVIAIVFRWDGRYASVLPLWHLLLLVLVLRSLARLRLAAVIDNFVYEDVLVGDAFGLATEAILHDVFLRCIERLELVVLKHVKRG